MSENQPLKTKQNIFESELEQMLQEEEEEEKKRQKIIKEKEKEEEERKKSEYTGLLTYMFGGVKNYIGSTMGYGKKEPETLNDFRRVVGSTIGYGKKEPEKLVEPEELVESEEFEEFEEPEEALIDIKQKQDKKNLKLLKKNKDIYTEYLNLKDKAFYDVKKINNVIVCGEGMSNLSLMEK